MNQIQKQLDKIAKKRSQLADLHIDLEKSIAIESLVPGIFDSGLPVSSYWVTRHTSMFKEAKRGPDATFVITQGDEVVKEIDRYKVPKILWKEGWK